MIHLALLLGCALVVYRGSDYFVNAVEWLGVRLRLGPFAVGSILAAVGTALPESIVTVVAVLSPDQAVGDEIAVGAAMGGPLVVGTIAYGVTGLGLLVRSRRGPIRDWEAVDRTRLVRDQQWFLIIFAAKVLLGLLVFSWKPWLGVLFVLGYFLYARGELRSGDARSVDPDEPLALQSQRAVPATWAIIVQTLGSLLVVFAACQVFVTQLEWAGPKLGLPTTVVALLLSPIATELPEVLNAVIWVRKERVQLALSNICGSMMIQATVPSAIGLWLTPWFFSAPVRWAGLATLVTLGALYCLLRLRRLSPLLLSFAAAGYLIFAVPLILGS